MKAIIDLETGGFSITKNAICEIGIIIINDNLEIIEERSFIVKPYTRPDSEELVSYKEDAMRVHGISMEEIETGEDVREVCGKIKSLFDYYQIESIIGHNLKSFDFPRIEYLLNRFISASLRYCNLIDTIELCREKYSFDCNKLESICKQMEIKTSQNHRALSDCKATLEVYKIIMEDAFIQNII